MSSTRSTSSLRLLRHASLTALLLAVTATACRDEDPTAPAAPKPVASVELLTTARAMRIGETLIFKAQARAADGEILAGRTVQWSSSTTAVLTIDADGRASAIAAGRSTVRATIDDKSVAAELEVSVVPVASVALSAAQLSLEAGESQALTATAYDEFGAVLTGRPATWTAEDTTIATVSATGEIAGRAEGQTRVVVEIEQRRDTVDVTVSRAAIATIRIFPEASVLELGKIVSYTARLYDARGIELTGRTVTWSTDAPAVAPTSAAGRAWGATPGYATVTATSEGKSTSTGLTVVNGEADALSHDLLYHRVTTTAWGEIMILGTDGTNELQRVNAGTVSREPTASPDGSRIAFHVAMAAGVAGPDRVDDIYAVDRDGLNMQRLTSESGIDDEPAWSPDGTRIAYRHMDPELGQSAIWVMNADGTGKVKLTALEGTHQVGRPSWSPDGSRLAFTTWQNGGAGLLRGIWTMRADGSDVRVVTATTDGWDEQPAWMPDGRRIVFTRTYDGDRDLTFVDVATGALQRLALPGQQWKPAPSPDGGHIAFYQPVGAMGRNGIYSMRADGTNVRLHRFELSIDVYDPTWIRRP